MAGHPSIETWNILGSIKWVTSYNVTPERSGIVSWVGDKIGSGIAVDVLVEIGGRVGANWRGVAVGDGVRVGMIGVSVAGRSSASCPPHAVRTKTINNPIMVILTISLL